MHKMDILYIIRCNRRAWKSGGTIISSFWSQVSQNRAKLVALQILIALVGLGIGIAIGYSRYHDTFQTQVQEYKLKCANRQEVVKAELANNLNTSFMVLGILKSPLNLNEETWLLFTNRTSFLRPNSPRVLWLQYVKDSDRASFEESLNSSILQLNLTVRPQAPEYAPILFLSPGNTPLRMVDMTTIPTLNQSVWLSRDTGIQVMSQPDSGKGYWSVSIFLPYYGQATPATIQERRDTCIGWIAVALELNRVFAAVLQRYPDDESMDVAVAFLPKGPEEWLLSYNCSSGESCEPIIYDPANREASKRDNSIAVVPWDYGLQNFELRCYPRRNIRSICVNAIYPWPLITIIVVGLCIITVHLGSKKMKAFRMHMMELVEKNTELLAAKLKAESTEQSKSLVLATVSHEIRTPMTGVIGMTNVLMNTPLTGEQQTYVQMGQRSGNNLLTLINQVLDLSKIDAGKMGLESVPFELRVVVDEVLNSFAKKAQENKLEVCILVHDSVPKYAIGDPAKIHQVLQTLVGNAMEYTKNGSIFVCVRIEDMSDVPESRIDFQDTRECLSARRPSIMVRGISSNQVLVPKNGQSYVHNEWDSGKGNGSLRLGSLGQKRPFLPAEALAPRLSMHYSSRSTKYEVNQWRKWAPKIQLAETGTDGQKSLTLVISVEDTGVGNIPVEEQRLFLRQFKPPDGTIPKEYGAEGIRITLCDKLVELMEGTMTLNSRPNIGRVFEYSIKVGRPRDISEMPTKCTLSEEERLKGLKVLLVDDHPVLEEVIASYLRALGISVECAEDKQSALDILHDKRCHSFQAMVLGLQDAEIELALQMVKTVRKTLPLDKLPILFVCSSSNENLKKEMDKAGVSQTLFRPVQRKTLAIGLLDALQLRLQGPPKVKKGMMLAGKRVLMVDDNIVNGKVGGAMLSRYGATVVCASDGEAALSNLQKRGTQFDLVLMDIRMPKMDGYEVTRRIRQWECSKCSKCINQNISQERSSESAGLSFCRTPVEEYEECSHERVPVVALSADFDTEILEQCFKSGMDDYLSKPLTTTQIDLLVEKFLTHDLHRQATLSRRPHRKEN